MLKLVGTILLLCMVSVAQSVITIGGSDPVELKLKVNQPLKATTTEGIVSQASGKAETKVSSSQDGIISGTAGQQDTIASVVSVGSSDASRSAGTVSANSGDEKPSLNEVLIRGVKTKLTDTSMASSEAGSSKDSPQEEKGNPSGAAGNDGVPVLSSIKASGGESKIVTGKLDTETADSVLIREALRLTKEQKEMLIKILNN